jgi:hypothetical protein
LTPMKPVHACDHTAILAQGGGVFQSLLSTGQEPLVFISVVSPASSGFEPV